MPALAEDEPRPRRPTPVDDVDRRLIELLIEDGRATTGALAAEPAALVGTGEADDPTVYVSGDLAASAGALDAAVSIVVSASGGLTAGAPSLTHRVATDTIEVSGALEAAAASLAGSGYLKPLPTFRILLSGDMQGGTDTLLLSGDLQVTGFDHEKHRPARPRRTQQAIFY